MHSCYFSIKYSPVRKMKLKKTAFSLHNSIKGNQYIYQSRCPEYVNQISDEHGAQQGFPNDHSL